jgi:hypothetical protein
MLYARFVLGFLVGVIMHSSFADSAAVQSSIIDADILKARRLFYSDTHRNDDSDHSTGLVADQEAIEADAMSSAGPHTPLVIKTATLQFTGLVRSERGLQILLNGIPWRAGDSNVISARLKLGSDLLEVTLRSGKRHRLSPGESIEVVP